MCPAFKMSSERNKKNRFNFNLKSRVTGSVAVSTVSTEQKVGEKRAKMHSPDTGMTTENS